MATKLVRFGALLLAVGIQAFSLVNDLGAKSSLEGVLWSTVLGAAVMYFVALFVMHAARESSAGLFGFALSRVRSTPTGKLVIGVQLGALVVRLVSAGLPDAQALALLGSWSAAISYSAGIASAAIVAAQLVRVRKREYDQMHEWGNPITGYLKSIIGRDISTPEMHKAVRFSPDAVEIYPVPLAIAMVFSDIEMNMARGHMDEWMLDPESSASRIRFVPIKDDWRARRATLRSSNYTLARMVTEEVEDFEILRKWLPFPEDLIDPNASSPLKPMSYETSQEFKESSFPQVQHFAVEQGMTIVGYDLDRWDVDRQQHEKLIYVQKASHEELVILEQIAARVLNGKTWNMWMEFHWVENEEDDRERYPRRIDSVVVKRSPLAGLDPEKRLAQWQLVIAMMPKGSDGWVIEDDQLTGLVTLKYGKKRSLPQKVPYDWEVPVTINAVPFAIDEHGTLVQLGVLETNLLIGGSPGGGKSGGITAYLSGIARLDHCAIIGIDPKLVEQAQWAPRFSRILEEPDEIHAGLIAIKDEMRQRYRWLKARHLKKLEPEHFEEMPLVVVVIDELADVVMNAANVPKGEADSAELLRQIVSLGRAAGFVVAAATQKPSSKVIPTDLRDLIQMRVAYATSNRHATETILGDAGAYGPAQEIAAIDRGVCYIVSESSRTPTKAKTMWVPDAEVPGIADRTAHLRVQLDWLDQDAPKGEPSQRGRDSDSDSDSASLLAEIFTGD